jgi:hypothetical protein
VSRSGGTQTDPSTPIAAANLTASSMAPIRRALSLAGVKCIPFLTVGDSDSSGYEAVGNETPAQSWPGYMRSYLGTPFGYPDGGSMVPTADAIHAPQWSYTGGWASAGAYYGASAAGVATYVSTDTFTLAVIAYYDAGPNFGWTVDGGANIPVVITGTNTVLLSFSGVLANTVHTIAVTSTTTVTALIAGGGLKANGVMYNNFAQTSSGVLAGFGAIAGAAGAWTSAAAGSVGQFRIGTHNQLVGGSFGPPLVALCIGSNDICAGLSTPAAVIAGYETLLTKFPAGTAFFVVTQFRQPTVTDAVWNAWVTALYAFAIKHNFPLFDWNARLGGYSAMLAAGMLQTDNIHPLPTANINIGQGIAQGLAS